MSDKYYGMELFVEYLLEHKTSVFSLCNTHEYNTSAWELKPGLGPSLLQPNDIFGKAGSGYN